MGDRQQVNKAEEFEAIARTIAEYGMTKYDAECLGEWILQNRDLIARALREYETRSAISRGIEKCLKNEAVR